VAGKTVILSALEMIAHYKVLCKYVIYLLST